MDLVDYSQEVFERIKKQYTEFSGGLEIRDIHFIPISALKGDNIVEPSANMPWYKGGPLLNHLETVHIASDRNMQDFRFPVQIVLRPNLDFRGFAGTIASGSVRKGDLVMVLPSGRKSKIKSIVTLDRELSEAHTPMAVTLTLEDEVDVSRGDMLVHPDNPPHFSHDLNCRVVWLNEKPLDPNAAYLVKHSTLTTPAEITLLGAIDVNTLQEKPATVLHLNEIGRCKISFTRPLAFDAYNRSRSTGALIIIDRLTFNTVGAGMIMEREQIKDQAGLWTTQAEPTNRLQSRVTPRQRQERLKQKAAMILLTGLTGSGKATISFALEEKLFQMGYLSSVLHGQELRRRMSRDLGFSADDRSENLRRAGEIAHIMCDAGLICICALLSPHAAVREKVRQLIGPERFLEIYLSAPVEVCKQRDTTGMYRLAEAGQIKAFPGVSAPYEPPESPDLMLATDKLAVNQSVEKIVDMLRQRGFIS